MSNEPLVVTPAQLLAVIAEKEPLELTCRQLGLTRERAALLLRGAARALQDQAPPDRAPAAPAARTPVRQRPPPARDDHATGLPARVVVYSDGASRGNPGPAGAGAVITDPGGAVLQRLGRWLGTATNNVAEYQGLLLGLEGALAGGAREVHVRADSELLIRQLEGRYQVKHPALRPLFQQVKALLARFAQVRLEHVPRAQNTLADEMSNRAIDERM